MNPVAATVGRMIVSRIRVLSASERIRGVAIGAHAAGVGSRVSVEHRLVVLRRRERNDIAAVGERDEADLLARQKLLDHEPSTQTSDCRLGRGAVRRDDDALARRQTIGLDDDRVAKARQRFDRFIRVAGGDEFGGRNPDFAKELLGEDFAAFELRRCRSGPDNPKPGRAEYVDDPGHQRSLWSDNRKIRLDRLRRGEQRLRRAVTRGDKLGQFRNPRISRCCEDTRPGRALRQAPHQRVLAAAASDYQNVHSDTIDDINAKFV